MFAVSTRLFIFALLALALLGYLLGQAMPAAKSRASAISATAMPDADRQDTSNRASSAITAAKVSSAMSREALPAGDVPLREIYSSLVERAQAGEAASARRLAQELLRCHARRWERGSLESAEEELKLKRTSAFDPQRAQEDIAAELERIDRRARLCAQISEQQTEQRGDWLLRAAELGDDDAAVCYAARGSSADFAPSQFTDAWFIALDRWRERAGRLAQRALDHGHGGAYELFHRASLQRYLGAPGNDFSALLESDPASAYAYASFALRVYRNQAAADNERVIVEFLRGRIDATRARQADRWAEQRYARDAAKLLAAIWENPCAPIAGEHAR
jgi:hypothetical protein